MHIYCCELLTIFYLYKVLCSAAAAVAIATYVVNCLQFFIFTRFFAVEYEIINKLGCCELLTIFYLYKVLCSMALCVHRTGSVVNCLQFFIFTRFFAVSKFWAKLTSLLWIAYNFLSLQGSLQLLTICLYGSVRCELLTIFYLYKVLCSRVWNHK